MSFSFAFPLKISNEWGGFFFRDFFCVYLGNYFWILFCFSAFLRLFGFCGFFGFGGFLASCCQLLSRRSCNLLTFLGFVGLLP